MSERSKQRRKREPTACARCRRLKRRCGRERPCHGCQVADQECRMLDDRCTVADQVIQTCRTEQDLDADLHLCDPGRISEAGAASSTIPSQLLPLLHDTHFVRILMDTWFVRLDYMYDSCRGIRLHDLWLSGSLAGEELKSMAPLIAAILALTCQLMPEKLDVGLKSSSMPSCSAPSLSLTAFRWAKDASDNFFDTWHHSKAIDRDLVGALHTSLLLAAFLKNADRLTQYRMRLSRDIAFLQCVGLPSRESRRLARAPIEVVTGLQRLWWSYYQYDRFYWFLDQSYPYQIRKDWYGLKPAADMARPHVSQKPTTQWLRSNSRRDNAPGHGDGAPGWRLDLSSFTCTMIDVATAVGEMSDKLAELDHVLHGFNIGDVREADFEQMLNAAVTELGTILSSLENVQAHYAQQDPGEARQTYVINITINTLRYKASTALARLAGQLAASVKWRLRKMLVGATSALVQRALGLTSIMNADELRWAFFLHYIGQSTQDLASLIDDGQQARTDVSELLGLLLKSRNLLCEIAASRQSSLATRMAEDVCARAARIIGAVDLVLQLEVADIRKIAVNVDQAQSFWRWRFSSEIDAGDVDGSVAIEDPQDAADLSFESLQADDLFARLESFLAVPA